ncbi:MAG: hypothetical protein ACKN9T_09675 [Candidatus Methylumidiphilus sp.]
MSCVSPNYEYCIPDEAEAVRMVKAIDPTAEVQRARGRVVCRAGMLLALGNTHQQGFGAVLAKLAALTFVVVIQESHFE